MTDLVELDNAALLRLATPTNEAHQLLLTFHLEGESVRVVGKVFERDTANTKRLGKMGMGEHRYHENALRLCLLDLLDV